MKPKDKKKGGDKTAPHPQAGQIGPSAQSTPLPAALPPPPAATPTGPMKTIKEVWLQAFQVLGTILSACKATGVGRSTFYDWKKADPDFARRFTEIDLDITDILKGGAIKRAMEWDIHEEKEKVLVKGELVETRKVWAKEPSDALLTFLLKARDPDTYKERLEHKVDESIIQRIISDFLAVTRKHALPFCPHCKNPLMIAQEIARDLLSLAGRMGGGVPAAAVETPALAAPAPELPPPTAP